MSWSNLLSRRVFLGNKICPNNFYFTREKSTTKPPSRPSDKKNSSASPPEDRQEVIKKPEEPKQLARIENIPTEYHEGPRKEVFQQIHRLQDPYRPIYTLEEAALPAQSEAFMTYFRYANLSTRHSDHYYGLRSNQNEYSKISQFPEVTDYLMIGSGLVGSATAYYVKKIVDKAADVCVLDKDPYSPTNCTAICSGLLSSQTKSRETFRISTLSKELIRNLQRDVVCNPEDFAQIKYRPCTHLVLHKEEQVEEVINVISEFIQDGCYTDTKSPSELERSFPWLKVVGTEVAIGTHGNQDEAIVDPIGLRNLYRTLAQAHGANFVLGEAIDFNTIYRKTRDEVTPNGAGAIVAKIPATGELRNLGFLKTLLSLGHNTPFFEEKSEMESYVRDQIGDMHFLMPKLRICINFHSFSVPVINFPVITDTDGSLLIRDDFAGNFRYYLPYDECEELFEQDVNRFMDLEQEDPFLNLMHKDAMLKDYFETVIKPRLVKRIPLMDDATFNLAYSGFESYNSHDGNPIIGIHPYHNKVLLSGGYGSRLMTYAPAAAVSICELMLGEEEETYDMTQFYWNRVIKNRKIPEFEILLQ